MRISEVFKVCINLLLNICLAFLMFLLVGIVYIGMYVLSYSLIPSSVIP